jgi:WbqC-like protein family
MKLAIMQPYFMPYFGYFQLINAVDRFIIYDDVNYIKKGWINRNNILLNNELYRFTIPLDKPSQNKLIKDILLKDKLLWFEKFSRVLTSAYQRAPFFDDVLDLLHTIVNSESKTISDLTTESIIETCKYVGIEKDFLISSQLNYNRNKKGQERIIEICKLQNSKDYFNPINGIQIYDRELFEKENIRISFLKMEDFEYKQFHTDKFVKNLSIIDILMFNEPGFIREKLNNYTLI